MWVDATQTAMLLSLQMPGFTETAEIMTRVSIGRVIVSIEPIAPRAGRRADCIDWKVSC